MKLRFIILIFLLFFSYFEVMKFLEKNEENLSSENIKNLVELKNGDIIFRKEKNIVSDMFSNIDKSPYSHIGIVFEKDGQKRIYHMEADEKSDDLKIQSVLEFTKNAKKVAVYRAKNSFEDENLKKILDEYEKNRIKFDYAFLLDNDTLYCTEFINEIYFKLFNENLYTYLFDFHGLNGITITSILKNTNLEKRYEINF